MDPWQKDYDNENLTWIWVCLSALQEFSKPKVESGPQENKMRFKEEISKCLDLVQRSQKEVKVSITSFGLKELFVVLMKFFFEHFWNLL
jgi:hypothetical protein